MKRARLLLIPLALSNAAPVWASAADPSVMAEYVRARAAEAAGMTDRAAAGYAAALAAAPQDPLIAVRAYRQAMMAGDRPLALRAARTLDASRRLPPDAQFLLLTDAVLAKDWAAATQVVDRIDQDGVYNFAAPVLRAWIARGSGKGDPLALLDGAAKSGAIATAYAADHRVLMLLALDRRDEAATAVQAMAGSGRALRLRIALAASYAAARDKTRALALLQGPEPLLATARQRIETKRPLPRRIDSAADGIADLLVRVAVDINRERVTPIALVMARNAAFLAPKSAESWLVTSELLADEGHLGEALAVLGNVRPDDAFADAARNQRMELLVKQGQTEAALKEALALNARQGNAAGWMRVGELYSQLDRPADAVAAYRRALAEQTATPDAGPRWQILLLLGSALDEAGDWPGARKVLEEAAGIAGDQAVVLNYLGYAQLERRENLAEAEKLIERASKLRPDDAAITDSLGWTYYVRGDVTRAIPTLERAVQGEPGEPTINEHLGDAYWSVGRRMEARFAWRAALVHAEEDARTRIATKIDTGLTPAVAAP